MDAGRDSGLRASQLVTHPEIRLFRLIFRKPDIIDRNPEFRVSEYSLNQARGQGSRGGGYIFGYVRGLPTVSCRFANRSQPMARNPSCAGGCGTSHATATRLRPRPEPRCARRGTIKPTQRGLTVGGITVRCSACPSHPNPSHRPHQPSCGAALLLAAHSCAYMRAALSCGSHPARAYYARSAKSVGHVVGHLTGSRRKAFTSSIWWIETSCMVPEAMYRRRAENRHYSTTAAQTHTATVDSPRCSYSLLLPCHLRTTIR